MLSISCDTKTTIMAKVRAKTPKQNLMSSIPEIPIKITVEVIIRDERVSFKSDTLENGALFQPESNCSENKFSYSFETDRATPLYLKVEAFEKNNPGSGGDFTACINDISNEPEIQVIALARRDQAGGRASLTLKFLGKDVITSKELKYGANGLLGINETAKLP